MPTGSLSRAVRIGTVAILLASTAVPMIAGNAAGQGSIGDARAKMAAIQARLDASTAQLEALRTETETVRARIDEIESQIATNTKRNERLQKRAAERARQLYMAGGSTEMLEVLLGSTDFSEVMQKADLLSTVTIEETSIFVRLARSAAELEALKRELAERSEMFVDARRELLARAKDLQKQLHAAKTVYKAAVPAPVRTTVLRAGSGMACPVAGPHSFTDTWGAPRSGHTHKGVDMMAAYGTPIAAIVSGSITLSDYGGSAGYWQILSGNDGNQYWYMHNQRNIVNGGPVAAGQQIATVGDTGNAAGTPHLHFEFHPGGGAAVNPYPLVASIC